MPPLPTRRLSPNSREGIPGLAARDLRPPNSVMPTISYESLLMPAHRLTWQCPRWRPIQTHFRPTSAWCSQRMHRVGSCEPLLVLFGWLKCDLDNLSCRTRDRAEIRYVQVSIRTESHSCWQGQPSHHVFHRS